MLKLGRQVWPLLVLGLLINTAYSVMWPLTTIYLHNDLQLSLVTSGWILAAYSGCNVLGGYLGGLLGDRYAVKRVGLALLVALIADALVGLWWNNVWGYPVVLIVFGLLTGGMLTLITTLTAQLSRANGRLFNLLYIFINLGLVVGTASIGVLFHRSLRPIFSLLLVCYGLATILWERYADRLTVSGQPVADPSAEQANRPTNRRRLGRLTLGVLLISLVLMWGTYAQWMSNVSIYIQNLGLSVSVYSHLWVYNGLLLILVQGAMARVSRLRSLPWQIIGGLVAISGSFLLLSTAHQIGGLFAAMTLLTIGEAVYVPGVPALINAYTIGNEGKYQGLVNAFSSLGKALGPVAGGWLIGQAAGYSGLLLVCMAVNAGVVVLVILGSSRFLRRS
ncbi:MFS transporter [Levilactobacillus suantsaii]|uniref:MFS transporter n=1 Tax=Levilactobacillus suantsaii TaxID=2292255 RepID=A0A4Q0VHS9_9LACO|nr:MFS transporter [Levilactobacillus suantsaii]RXI78549.1 MFS transporter [Levilactobacillus suantsaii]